MIGKLNSLIKKSDQIITEIKRYQNGYLNGISSFINRYVLLSMSYTQLRQEVKLLNEQSKAFETQDANVENEQIEEISDKVHLMGNLKSKVSKRIKEISDSIDEMNARESDSNHPNPNDDI